jgi:hypothetical protein
MTGYQTGGLFIIFLGVFMLTASLPTLRMIPRNSHLATQFGNGTVSWLTRVMGMIICMLGWVTYLQG